MTQATGELLIDTSAVMAMLLQESDAETLIDAAVRASVVHLSVASRLELRLVAEGAPGALRPTAAAQGPGGLAALRQRPPPGGAEIGRLFQLWTGQGPERPPAVQGHRLRRHRRQIWALERGNWEVFDSSTGFRLADGSVFSSDQRLENPKQLSLIPWRASARRRGPAPSGRPAPKPPHLAGDGGCDNPATAAGRRSARRHGR